mmetsp:Transcript_2087/g.3276  ORF Transcript_2087/g.3276 Transcript_2087/m.3276 type:complete len:99 (-) Transcript_2087:102-398(-)
MNCLITWSYWKKSVHFTIRNYAVLKYFCRIMKRRMTVVLKTKFLRSYIKPMRALKLHLKIRLPKKLNLYNFFREFVHTNIHMMGTPSPVDQTIARYAE